MGSDLESLASHTISRSKLDALQLEKEVASLGPRWSIDGQDLKLELRGQPMSNAGKAAAQAATLADEMDHHPTIVLEYAGMTLQSRVIIEPGDKSLANLLQQALKSAKLGYDIRDGFLVIDSRMGLVESRLQRVEEKLDRIVKSLEKDEKKQ